MKISPSGIAGIGLIGPESEEFEAALVVLPGRASGALLAPALPYSVIVANDSGRSIALLGVRFDMTGPRAKPYTVIHYADTLRNPDKADFVAGARRFVCAEPYFTNLAFTSPVLHGEGEVNGRARNNLDNLRKMRDIRASIDCVAYDDGRFEGPDTLGAFERLARQREMEAAFTQQVLGAGQSEAEPLLLHAAEDADDRARRTLARMLLAALQLRGHEEMLARARAHRLKIAVWR